MKPKKPTLEDQLSFISAQQGIYPMELFQALIYAKEEGKSSAQDLDVEYRGSVGKQAIFLLTKDQKVVAQFRVPEETIRRKDVSFDNWMDTKRVRREIERQNPPPERLKIENLRPSMRKVNVVANVLETSEPSRVHTQFRDDAIVSNAVVGDETGRVLLCLWDEQVNSVQVGDHIEVKNAHVALFKGEKQLRLGKKGTITVLEKPVVT
jgi:replication factor A1